MSTPTVSSEPVLSVSFVTSAIIAVIALLTAYNFDVSPEQSAAIVGIGAIVAKTIGAVIARSKVSPVAGLLIPQNPGYRSISDERGSTSVFYALGVALIFSAVALAVLTLLNVVAPVSWVGIVILGAVGIFLVYWAGRGTGGRVA